MDTKWWLATALIPLALALAGAVVSYVRYRLELRRFYGNELFTAGSGLLLALHHLNNSHQGETDYSGPNEFVAAARKARDEVWRHQSQLQLIGTPALVEATDSLVKEYMSSSPERDEPRPINRKQRKSLRHAFVSAWRKECPGFPGGNRN